MYILIRLLKNIYIKNILINSYINVPNVGINIHKKLKLFSIKVINYYLFLILYYSYVNFLINSPYGLFFI